ncbi:MAG: hypothetical protein ACRD2E_10250 [Terriglobales bacterium]
MKGEIAAAKKMRLPWWALLCIGVGALPIYWLFDHFGRLNIALPILNVIVVLGFMLALKRRLWPHAWFWITMAVIAALHVPLILLVPWGNRWVPALAIAGIDSVDFCLILWILAFVGKLTGGPREGPRTADR